MRSGGLGLNDLIILEYSCSGVSARNAVINDGRIAIDLVRRVWSDGHSKDVPFGEVRGREVREGVIGIYDRNSDEHLARMISDACEVTRIALTDPNKNELVRYKVRYDPNLFPSGDEIPEDLRRQIADIWKESEFYAHSSKRHFLAVGLPQGKKEQVARLKGILEISEDFQYSPDCRWARLR